VSGIPARFFAGIKPLVLTKNARLQQNPDAFLSPIFQKLSRKYLIRFLKSNIIPE